MSIDIGQFVQVFLEEAREHLGTMEADLLAIDLAAPDTEVLNAIFRSAHSIKGGAGTFGFGDVAEFTHTLETLLDRVRKAELALDEDRVDACLRAVDVLTALLFGVTSGGAEALANAHELAVELTRLTQSGTTESARLTPVTPAPEMPAAQAVEHVLHIGWPLVSETDAAQWDHLVAALCALGSVTVDAKAQGLGERCALRLNTRTPADEVRDLLSFVIDPSALSIEQAPTAEVEDAYGLFDVAPGAGEGSDYGFFDADPVQAAESAFGVFDDEPAATQVETAYGLFEPVVSPPVTDSDRGIAPQPVAVTTRPVVPKGADKPAAAGGDTSIRVGTGKVDQLINLVGELVITQSMLLQSARDLDPITCERLLAGLAQLERNSRDLQEAVMSIRMVPMSFVFSRFPRMVRDLAKKLDKQAELQLVGESTELDKGLIEKIVDPLTHLVRNAVDHGLESPEQRLAKSKSAVGQIVLSAAHQSGNIVIEIVDDGAGLDRDRILAKARSNGLPVSDDLSDAEVWDLIFAPGFSTAEQITDVSGRGVGMDVVRKNIQALGGSVHLSSGLGQGTRVSIRLPLTLAILDGMSVRAQDEIFIVPLGFVVESIQADMLEFRTMGREGQLVRVRDEYLPVASLASLFDIPGASGETGGVLVVVEAQNRKLALAVDELVGQHQVVVKNLETNYRRVAGISGATILGDGRVSMILDVAGLIELTQPLAA